jgi:hypothetical protein
MIVEGNRILWTDDLWTSKTQIGLLLIRWMANGQPLNTGFERMGSFDEKGVKVQFFEWRLAEEYLVCVREVSFLWMKCIDCNI